MYMHLANSILHNYGTCEIIGLAWWCVCDCDGRLTMPEIINDDESPGIWKLVHVHL